MPWAEWLNDGLVTVTSEALNDDLEIRKSADAVASHQELQFQL